jgi:hypothetical protein
MNSNEFYKLKYLKYKNKYISLKNKNVLEQKGGASGFFRCFFNRDDFTRKYTLYLENVKGIFRAKVGKDKKETKLNWKDLLNESLLIIPYTQYDVEKKNNTFSPPNQWIFPSQDGSELHCPELQSEQIRANMTIKDYFLLAKSCARLQKLQNVKILQNAAKKIIWVDLKVYPVFPNEIMEFDNNGFVSYAETFLVYIDKQKIASSPEQEEIVSSPEQQSTEEKFVVKQNRFFRTKPDVPLSISEIKKIFLLVIPFFSLPSIFVTESPPSDWRFQQDKMCANLKEKVVTTDMKEKDYFELVKDCFTSVPKNIYCALVSEEGKILAQNSFVV